MLNNGMYSSKTDLWSTPQDFYDELNREFKFVLDACALPCNAKCKSFFGYSTNDVVSYKNGNYEQKFTNVVLR